MIVVTESLLQVVDIAFSEDGSTFVTVGNRHVKFWYMDSSKSRVSEHDL